MNTIQATKRLMTQDEVLRWIKQALAEMAECKHEATFVTMGTALSIQTFEFLYERVRAEHIPMRKGHMNYHPQDSMRDFIAQVDTVD